MRELSSISTIHANFAMLNGTALTDAIQREWGGKPFDDLIRGYKHILNEYPEIDAERAVAAGGSYGGYAIK